MRRWLSGDTLTQTDLQASAAGGLSLYDLGGPFLMLAAVVSALLAASVARHCIRRRRASVNRLPGAKLVIPVRSVSADTGTESIIMIHDMMYDTMNDFALENWRASYQLNLAHTKRTKTV